MFESQPTDDSVGKLSQLVALGESGFLVRDSSNNHYTWRINQYKHIKDASLGNDSLANAAITTNYWKENSISNDKFSDNSVQTEHLINKSFTHGKYFVTNQKSTSGYLSGVSIDGGKKVITINDGGSNKDKVYQSTNGGQSFSSIYTASGETLQTIHARGQSIVIGTSSGNVLFSSDEGANFSKITSTPFSSDARVGYAFDSNNFLVIGKNSSNQIIPAKYDSNLGTVISLKNSSNQEVVIYSDAGTTYGWDISFVDGNTGYLTVNKPTTGNVVYKTNDGGYSWSSLLSASAEISRIQVFSDGDFYLVNDNIFYDYASDVENSKFTFPASVGNASAIHFLSTEIGFVGFDSGLIYASYDGGASFEHLSDLGGAIHEILALDSSKMMITGTGSKTYQLIPQFDHYPIQQIENSDLNTTYTLLEHQIEVGSLSVDDLSDDSITEDALAEASLDGSKLADDAVAQSKIKTRSIDRFLFAFESLTTAKFTTDGVHGDQFGMQVITGNMIKLNTIGGNQLADSNITSDTLTDGAITKDIIKDDSLYGSILKNEAITNSDLKDESFTEFEFATGIFEDVHFIADSIKREHLSTPNFDLQEDSITLHTLTKNSLQDDQIDKRLINNNSIYGFNILNNQLTQSKLSGAIVTEGKWQDDSITSDLINDQVVTSAKIKSNQITGSHFIDETISRSKYDNTSIPADKIKEQSISYRELGDNSVIAGKLSSNSSYLLGSSKFQSKIISSGNLTGTFSQAAFDDDVFTSTRIADRLVTLSKMKEDFLTSGQFMDNGLLNADFNDTSIIADHIRTGDNYADKLANNSITYDQIASHTLTNSSLASGIIVSKFADEILFAEQLGTINESHLANDAILANHIKKYSLKAANFNSDSFQSNEFANNSIVSPNLNDDVIVLADMNNDVVRTEHIKSASPLK